MTKNITKAAKIAAKPLIENEVNGDTIRAMIATLAGSEKITKTTLATLSRDMLKYVPKSDRIELVNELLLVLTPQNRKMSVLFFKHFLPWSYVDSDNAFGKKFDAGKKTLAKADDCKEFLANVNSTIWTWADDNVAVEFKIPDYKKMISSSITNALAGKKNPGTGEKEGSLELSEIVNAIIEGGIKSASLVGMIDAMSQMEHETQDTIDLANAGVFNTPKQSVSEEVVTH